MGILSQVQRFVFLKACTEEQAGASALAQVGVFAGLVSGALTVQHQVQSSAGAVNPMLCQHRPLGEPCPCVGQDNLIPGTAMARACMSAT